MSKTIYVDIDETICHHPDSDAASVKGARDYSHAVPLKKNIEKINSLFIQGNTIVYWTARGSRTGIDWYELTKNQLIKWGAKHHDLKCSKPFYDFFVEDRSVRIEELLTEENAQKSIRYLRYFEKKDIKSLSELFSDDVYLRDWEWDVKGKSKVVEVFNTIFNSVKSISVKIESLCHKEDTVWVESTIDIDGQTILVSDLLEYNEEGKLSSIKAFKG